MPAFAGIFLFSKKHNFGIQTDIGEYIYIVHKYCGGKNDGA